ncbi:hypothetical protein COCNU_07G014590 [Cocos nucifera]|uniref:Uncharacterized protein n=1 Tax=Cocos nucifera TaxID=13894 RepID=A0A8K0IGS4_COCNU|nr:hypothetical protein COCNU_07G014590 [Cocos nucifera]
MVEESLLLAKLERMERLSFLNQQKEAFISILKSRHYATIFMNTIKTARSDLAKVREKSKTSQKAVEAKIGHLKEALKKAKIEKAKAKADGASKKKRRKVVEAKVIEVEKKDEGQVIEAEHLAVEAFKSSPKFTKIKVEFDGEAFKARYRSQSMMRVISPGWSLVEIEESVAAVSFAPNSWADYEEIVKEADQYNGFNLILTDLCSKVMVYISNRPKGEPISVQTVPSGLHVISNGKLDAPWPKSQRLGKNFNEFLRGHGKKDVSLKGMVEELMGDDVKASRDELPDTGVEPEWEFQLSSIFIDTDTKLGRYGTRSMAAISVKTNGNAIFYEKHLESSSWKENIVKFHVKKSQHI